VTPATFVYTGLPARVVFGSGTITRLADEVARLGIRRAIVLATPNQASEAERIAAAIDGRAATVFAGAVMHTPVEVTAAALAVVEREAIDGVVAVGGGSTIGLGKAIAVRTGVPQVAVPTTYAGSEMTPILGETENGVKTTRRSLDILPETVLYDVDLTLGLPVGLSITSGINAIAHAVEALYAEDRNPIVSLMAEDGVRALAAALPILVTRPRDGEARAQALYGAWLCGACLGSVGMALHHKLCHTLGGTFDLPHAETHTVVLPHAIAYNAPAAPEAMARLARALGGGDPARTVFDLARSLGAPTSLAAIGMPATGIDRAAELAVKNPYWNPRPVERAAIRDLIARAHAGEAPQS
jgi:alcohol dehydrogenase class IV